MGTEGLTAYLIGVRVPVLILVMSVPVAALVGGVVGWILRSAIGRKEVEHAVDTGEFRLGKQFYKVIAVAPKPKRRKQ